MRIAIVGAGPAGAAAGWHLATRGYAVTLVDAALFPRDKTCGDWLTPLALYELALLGLDRAALARAAPGHATVTTTRLSAPSRRLSTYTSGVPGACIPRRILDALARGSALAAGCEPVQRTIRPEASRVQRPTRRTQCVSLRTSVLTSMSKRAAAPLKYSASPRSRPGRSSGWSGIRAMKSARVIRTSATPSRNSIFTLSDT